MDRLLKILSYMLLEPCDAVMCGGATTQGGRRLPARRQVAGKQDPIPGGKYGLGGRTKVGWSRLSQPRTRADMGAGGQEADPGEGGICD